MLKHPSEPTDDQVESYRASLKTISPQTVWHTLNRATVIEPDQIPDGMAWRVPLMRLHLIVLEYRGEWFLEDPATMGLKGTERVRWERHSARRHTYLAPNPVIDLRETLGRNHYGDAEYDRMRDAGELPGGLR